MAKIPYFKPLTQQRLKLARIGILTWAGKAIAKSYGVTDASYFCSGLSHGNGDGDNQT